MKELEIKKQLPVITSNYEEVKQSLINVTDKYKNYVVTEENLKDCKQDQKTLAGVRVKIDKYRKDIKKEMEGPIKIFENQCKELINIVTDAEKPIKEGIEVFNDKKREEKRKFAYEEIEKQKCLKKLNEKYGEQLTIKPTYLNLSCSQKSVREDIEQRAEALLKLQEDEEKQLQMITSTVKTTIECVNKDLVKKLKYEDFEHYIEKGFNLDFIVQEINKRAAFIKEAERIIKEETKEEIKEEVKEEIKREVRTAPPKKECNTKHYIEMEICDSIERMKALSNFLKTNGYKYNVKASKVIKND